MNLVLSKWKHDFLGRFQLNLRFYYQKSNRLISISTIYIIWSTIFEYGSSVLHVELNKLVLKVMQRNLNNNNAYYLVLKSIFSKISYLFNIIEIGIYFIFLLLFNI